MGKAKRGRPLPKKEKPVKSTNDESPKPPDKPELPEIDEEETLPLSSEAVDDKNSSLDENSNSDDDEGDDEEAEDENDSGENSEEESEEEVIPQAKNKQPEKSKKTGSESEYKLLKAKLTKPMKASAKKKSQASSSTRNAMMTVVLSGLMSLEERKGVSIPALKKYIMQDEAASNKNWSKIRPKVRAALEAGMEDNLILRAKGSENLNGLTGRFKVNKKEYNKIETNKERDEAEINVDSKKSSKDKIAKVPPKAIKKIQNTKEPTKRGPKSSGNSKDSKVSKKPKTDHRRSVSGDSKKVIAVAKKKLAKSKSMEQLVSAPKKLKNKK